MGGQHEVSGGTRGSRCIHFFTLGSRLPYRRSRMPIKAGLGGTVCSLAARSPLAHRSHHSPLARRSLPARSPLTAHRALTARSPRAHRSRHSLRRHTLLTYMPARTCTRPDPHLYAHEARLRATHTHPRRARRAPRSPTRPADPPRRQHVRLERPQRLEREDVGGSSRSGCAISGSSWCGS